MTSEAQKAAVKRYKEKNREQMKRITLTFFPSELEVFNHLQKQEQKQTYIKDLIRKDMEKAGE